MSTQVLANKVYSHSRSTVPQLQNGDRLDRAEFHRRYEAMPKAVKAELVKGIVFMASPVRADKHGKPHSQMMFILATYQTATPGLELLDNATYLASEDYEPQPDGILRVEERYGGTSRITEDGYLEGTPELVMEISSSSASYDLHDKLDLYEENGIPEYLVWRVLDEQVDWFHLESGKYRRFEADRKGRIESLIFPGLRLNIGSLLADDLRTAISDLKTGLKSKKYLEFVKNLTK